MTTYTDVFGSSTTPAVPSSYGALSFSTNTTLLWPFDSSGGDYLYALNDITPSAGSLALTLPDASAVSKGKTAIFQNKGAYDVTLKDPGANTVATIVASTVVLLYLSDNSTANGTWEVVQLGTGSSAVDAASLIGYGVKAIGASLNQAHPVTTTASGITVTTAYRAKLVNYTGGADTFAFSPTTTLGDDFFALIRNSGTGTLTLNPDSSETIDGQTTLEVQPGESLIVACSGAALFTVGLGRSILYNFTQLTKDVSAGGTFTLTANEAANKLLTFTGNPGSNVTVVVPSTVAVYYILNSLSTAKSVTVKTTAGTGVAVSQSARIIAICDATNVYSAQSVSASTSVQLVDGSAAAPSLAFSSTTNTGLYKYGSDGIGITVAGTPIFTCDSTSATLLTNWTAAGVTCANGGTVTTIDINGGTIDGAVIGGSSASAGTFTTLTTTGNVTLGDASGDSVTINAATVSCANGLNFDSNTFVIDATNNRVGLGTSSPAYALDASVATGTTVVGNGTVARFVSSTTDGDANIRLGSGSNSTVRFGASGTAAYIYTNGAERVRIDSSGNVGIGTSSPNQKLHVFGNAVDTAAQITKNGTDSIQAGVDSAAYVGAGGAIALRTGGFTSAYDKAKLDSSGNFLVGVSSATTNGGKIETSNGVTFPATQSACSNANTLDDYEEGTWNATDNSGGSLSLTLSGCKYQKVGNRVTIAGKITYPTGGTGIPALITLPITAAATATASSVIVTDTGVSVGLFVLGGSSTTSLFIKNPTSGAAINNSALDGKILYILLSYEAA